MTHPGYNVRVRIGPLALVAVGVLPAAADVSADPAGLQPRTARVVKTHRIAEREGWTNADLSRDGGTISFTIGFGTLAFFDALTGAEIARIERAASSIHDTALSPDGRRYALTLDDGTVEVYSIADKRLAGSFRVSNDYCCSLNFSADGRWLVAEDSGSLILWDVRLNQRHTTLAPGLSRSVYTYVSPNGRYACAFAGTPALVDLEEGRVVSNPAGMRGATAVFSPDSRSVLGYDGSGTPVVWEVPAGAERFRIELGDDRPSGFAFSPDGRWIAVGGIRGRVYFAEARTGRIARVMELSDPGSQAAPFTLAFDRKGRRLIVLDGSLTVHVIGHRDP